MKKLLVVPALLLLLTGCGSNKLECSMEKEESGVKMTGTAVMSFDKDEITHTEVTMDVTIPDEYKSMSDLMMSSLSSTYDTYKEYGAEVSVEKKSDSRILAKIAFDTSKLTKENLEKLEKESMYFKGTKDEVKKAMEKEGFTCK